jgi:hypothetical protein
MSMPDNTGAKGEPVEQDRAYYKRLFSNSPAKMPADHRARLDDRSTYELMLERDAQKTS